MLFEEYYKIMKEPGIGEVLFLYNGKECSILMEIINFSLNYSISFGEEFYSSDDFDEIVSCKHLSIGKTLKEIWGEIEILLIDGVSENDYDEQTVYKWLENFYRRFFAQQFKRSCVPDGVKVGSVSLSPRGDFAMPSDAYSAEWLKDLKEINL